MNTLAYYKGKEQDLLDELSRENLATASDEKLEEILFKLILNREVIKYIEEGVLANEI